MWGETGLHHVPLAFQCIYRCSDERGKNGDGKEGRKWRLPGLLYADDLEDDLKVTVEWFAEVCRRGMKFNAGKSKVIITNGV